MTTMKIKRCVVGAVMFLSFSCLVGRLITTRVEVSAQEKQSPPAAPQEDKPAEQVYKNIEIFKGVPASRLMPGMQRLTQFLGVECVHCHVPNQFDKDDKPTKQNARKMFRMVRLVSQELKTDRVTCYTCHRGKPQPEPPPDSWQPTEEQRKQAAQDTRPAEQVYKNIQSLKGVPAGRWMIIMNMFSKSLGVDCTHCHVPDAYEKDDKPTKQMARKMLRLTGSIYREIYQSQMSPINCYTCHRGQIQPVTMPPATTNILPKFDDKPSEIKSSASLPSVDQVLAKYVQALGGQAALEKVTTRVMKGALVTPGLNAPLEVYEKAPNKTLTTFRNPGGANFMGFNGTVGWVQAPENGLREVSGMELARIKRDAEFYRDLKLKERYSKLVLLGSAKLGDRETYVIEATPPEGNPEKFFFDASIGLLIRQDITVGVAPRESSIQVYFEDYREVDGIKLPFAIRRSRPDFTWVYKFDEIKLNVPVEETKFNKPPA